MKVTHCLAYYSKDFKGGIQRYIDNILIRQKNSEINIFTTTSFADDNDAKGIYRVRSYGTFLRTPISPAYVSKLKKMDSDVFHFHSPNPLIDFSAVKLNRTYVVNVHNTFPHETAFNYAFIELAKKLLIKNLSTAGRVVVYNKNLLKSFTRDGRLLKRILDKTVEIPPGLDKDKFKNLHLERNNDVLFVAHIRPEKGLHVLVDSFKYIKHRDSRLVVLAKVTYFKGYFDKLIRRARSLLGDRLIVIINPTDEQIVSHYNKCGCVVCPSIALESWNFVLMEAAGCGAPIVRSDLDAMKWLKDSCCFVAKANDPEDLAEKIDSALSRREQFGKNAEKEVSRYDWKNTADSLIDIYREMME